MIQKIRLASSLAILGASAVASGALLAVCFAARPAAPEVNEPLALEAATFNLAQPNARALWDGEQAALSTCMRRRGVAYTPARFPEAFDLDPGYAVLTSRDLRALEREGYGIARSEARNARATRIDETAEPPHPGSDAAARFLAALLGPDVPADFDAAHPPAGWEAVPLPNGGSFSSFTSSCQARAARAVYGPTYPHGRLDRMVRDLQSGLIDRLTADAAYRAALSDWRGCMLERGYTDATPLAAARALRRAHAQLGLDLAQLREQELALASADVRCDQRVSFDARARAARHRAESVLRLQYADWLPAMEAELNRALRRARDLADRHAELPASRARSSARG